MENKTLSVPRDLMETILHALNVIPNTKRVGKDGESSYTIAAKIDEVMAAKELTPRDKAANEMFEALCAVERWFDDQQDSEWQELVRAAVLDWRKAN